MATLRRCRVLASVLVLGTGLAAGAPPAGAGHVDPPPGGFFPVTPARLLDTRSGVGAPPAKVGPGQEVELQVAGRGGVPSDQVAAVALNLAVTEPTAEGYLTAYPTGEARPVASNTNFVAGQTLSTAAVVKLGTGGRITIFNASGASHVVVDVGGWHARYREAGTPYTPVSPVRVFDSRQAKPLAPGGTATVDVGRGVAGVEAVALNVTATDPTADTFLTVYPAGETLPLAANLNVLPGQTRGNFVAVKVADGRVRIFNNSGTTHVVVDLLGYWAPTSVGRLTPVTPVRSFDTRLAPAGDPWADGIGPQETFLMPASGGSSPVPQGAAAGVVLNVTVTQPATDGWLTVYPADTGRPFASNLNYKAGETVPNLVFVPVNQLGHTNFYTSGGPVHVVVDLVGWFDDLGDLELPTYERDVAGGMGDVVIDPTSTYAFVSNTGRNRVEVLRLDDGLFEAPIPVDAFPRGVDLSPSGDRLYVATRAGVSEVDVAARVEHRRFPVPGGDRADHPLSVAVLADGTALMGTSRWGGFGTGMYQVDLATGTITRRLDFGSFDPVWVRASGDGMSAAVLAGTSPARLFRYDTAAGTFGGPVDVPGFGGTVATDFDGSVIVAGGHLFTGTLQHVGDLACGVTTSDGITYAGGGVALTAAGDVAYDIGMRGMGRCLGRSANDVSMSFEPDGVGQLALSPDGASLVGITTAGVAVGKPLL